MDPPDSYDDPYWDFVGNPAHWTHYVDENVLMDWFCLPDTERLRLARQAEARAELWRRNTGETEPTIKVEPFTLLQQQVVRAGKCPHCHTESVGFLCRLGRSEIQHCDRCGRTFRFPPDDEGTPETQA